MELTKLIEQVVDVFDRLRIPYFITGSVASIAFGTYRTTADVDIVARIELSHVNPFARSFPSDRFYVSEYAIEQAIHQRSQFNIIDSLTGYKADIVIPGQSKLDKSRFERAIQLHLPDIDREIKFSSPEDVILKKLEFFKEGQSEKHMSDIAGIVSNMSKTLDMNYISKWATTLDVHDVWQSVLPRARNQ